MKTKPYLLVSLLAAAAAAVHAQQMEFLPDANPPAQQNEQVKYTLLKPDDKTFESVREGEHNPYGKSDSELHAGEQKGTNEENQIRDILVKLPPVGRSPGPQGGLRVMLGDMWLTEGQIVPKVLPEQTVTLRVGRITPESIELIWVEKKPSGLPARTMIIPMDLRPSVRIKLPGQAPEKNQSDKSAVGDVPFTHVYSDVAQTPASSTVQMARNTVVPRAVPVDQPPAPAATSPTPPKPTIKADPQWEKAMSLLDKFLAKETPAP